MYDRIAQHLSCGLSEHLGRHAKTCTLVSGGINKIFRCSGGVVDLFVRMVPTSYRSVDELNQEMRVIRELSDAGLPVCGLPDLDVDLVFGPVKACDQEFHGLVMNGVGGRKLSPIIADNAALAASLAKLHTGFCTTKSKPSNTRKNTLESTLAKPALEHMAAYVRELKAEVSLQVGSERIGFCHGDAWHGNAIECKDEAILIDFEHHHFGPVSFDIATQLWWLRNSGLDKHQTCANAFISAYSARSGIVFSEVELRHQILVKELRNLKWLDTFTDLGEGVEDEAVARSQSIVQWVQQG